ncbi:hypothetical protein K435DRAFT_800056 [Dendrothele bispora CBS 962.96]|uniref:Uncharacterized protein n=1 Tax=Dendrothele bispora (strain CBS 962.96) TaxID=1314807 RepID=A0A4S8LUH6_DENBC|nr:hypothetical protein K435DRAFT_800056 [Dendrothele bispora CBS 962.96]
MLEKFVKLIGGVLPSSEQEWLFLPLPVLDKVVKQVGQCLRCTGMGAKKADSKEAVTVMVFNLTCSMEQCQPLQNQSLPQTNTVQICQQVLQTIDVMHNSCHHTVRYSIDFIRKKSFRPGDHLGLPWLHKGAMAHSPWVQNSQASKVALG